MEGFVVLDVVHHAGHDRSVHVVDQVHIEQDEDGGCVGLVQVREPGMV